MRRPSPTTRAGRLIRSCTQEAQSVTEGLEQQALEAAVAHLFERRSVAATREIFAETLNQEIGSVDLVQVQRAVANEQANLVRLTPRDDTPLLSECCTRYGLELGLARRRPFGN